jgi:hypothetical protein
VYIFGWTGAIEFFIVAFALIYASWRLIKTINKGVSADSNVQNLN